MEGDLTAAAKRLAHKGRRLMRRARRRRAGREAALFLARWLKAPHLVGALTPSSPHLARAMAQQVDLRQARLVVELGGGTGSITAALLDAGLPPERLIVVERDPELHALLRRRFPEVRVVHGDAAFLVRLLRRLGVAQASAIVSSLPLLSLPRRLRQRIIEQAFAVLGEHGRFVQFTYGVVSPIPSEHGVLGHVAARVWRNFPPATVWRFHRPARAIARVA
jgi:phosphatidylethanolamine/phosphatidyl-N-methylethanolamine N-methyltransferase